MGVSSYGEAAGADPSLDLFQQIVSAEIPQFTLLQRQTLEVKGFRNFLRKLLGDLLAGTEVNVKEEDLIQLEFALSVLA